MANQSPFIPGSWPDGAPLTGTRSSDGPNYWANPPIAPNDSELSPAPPIAEPPPAAPHPLAWIPTVVEARAAEEPTLGDRPVEELAVEELAVETAAADEPVINEPAPEPVVVSDPVIDEPVVAQPVFSQPEFSRPVVDEPVAPAFSRMQRAPYTPPPAPVIDLTREAEIDPEREADDFREVATPVRGGLFARYTPPVLDPLPADGSHRKKRRHGPRSRH